MMPSRTFSLGSRLQSAALRYRVAGVGRDWPPRRVIPAAWRYATGGAPEPSGESSGDEQATSSLARVEAVLFLAREPVPSRKLAVLAGVADGTQARSLVRKLRKQYDVRGTAFQVEEIAGGFQLLTRRKFAPWLGRLEQAPGELRLSQPAMETLAVVAYRQPVLRAEIEAIRGVQCGEILRQLMDRDLARIVGRAEELGRPFLYGTTKRFLQLFGLKHLEEIPRGDQLRSEPLATGGAVAKPATGGNDSHSENLADQATSSDEEVSAVITTDELNRMEELWTNASAPPVAAGPASIVAFEVEEEEFEEDDEDLDDDEEEEFEDDEDEDDDEYEDDEEEEDEDEEEEDEDLEGEWEEVDDEDEDDEDDEEEDEDDDEFEDEDDEDWEEEDEDEEVG